MVDEITKPLLLTEQLTLKATATDGRLRIGASGIEGEWLGLKPNEMLEIRAIGKQVIVTRKPDVPVVAPAAVEAGAEE